MVKVRVTSQDGEYYELDAPNGEPLMETLRDEDMGVEGICGGQCACGTCHVYVDPEWIDRLQPRSEDEEIMLEAISELIEVRTNSRLSCQIEPDDSMEGLTVEVAPEF